MNWEGTGDSTRILRGPDGKPIATVTGTFATVTHNGKTQRMNHVDLLAAQAWCAGVLAGATGAGAGDDTHRAAMGLRPRGPTFTAPEKSGAVSPKAGKVAPNGTPLERLLVVLRKDPDLAWGVCQGAKALGPWTPFAGRSFLTPNADGTDSETRVDWYQRTDARGFIVAEVRIEAEEDGGWFWDGHAWDDQAESLNGPLGTSTEAQQACDEYLRASGWLLASQPA